MPRETVDTSVRRSGASDSRPAPAPLSRVIEAGLCVGCGLCANASHGALRMVTTAIGTYLPALQNSASWETVRSAANVCPFAGGSEDEDTLGRSLFARQLGVEHSDLLGYFLRTDAVWVTDERSRLASSAGGLATWLTRRLLESDLVDGVICVAPDANTPAHFRYQMVRDPAKLELARKSRYYPIELSEVINELAHTHGRYAIVALPCFAKALRLAIDEGIVPAENVHCIVGLFCGHLKTRQFARYLTRCCGAREADVTAIDFRHKLPERPASDYAFAATARTADGCSATRVVHMRDTMLGNWGLNAFMLKACECCDDVVAECADIAIGDAWLPEFAADGRGTNLVVTRRRDLADILTSGVASGELARVPVLPSAVAASQDGAFRQRRQGLAYRLHLATRRGEWRPRKRVAPDRAALKFYGRLIQRLRLRIAHSTVDNFQRCENEPGLAAFHRRVWPLVALHNSLYALRRRWCHVFRR